MTTGPVTLPAPLHALLQPKFRCDLRKPTDHGQAPSVTSQCKGHTAWIATEGAWGSFRGVEDQGVFEIRSGDTLTGGPSEPGMPGSPGFPRGPCEKMRSSGSPEESGLNMTKVPARHLRTVPLPDTPSAHPLSPRSLSHLPSLHEGQWHPEARGDPTHREREIAGLGTLSTSIPHSA